MKPEISPLPWIPSQYLDTDEWGILATNNEIVIALSPRYTKEQMVRICRAVNHYDELVQALELCICRINRLNIGTEELGPDPTLVESENVLRKLEEGK